LYETTTADTAARTIYDNSYYLSKVNATAAVLPSP